MSFISIKRLQKGAIRLLVFCAILYMALAIALFALQDKMIFQPNNNNPKMTPKDINLDYQSLTINASNHDLHAWFIPAIKAKGTVLFCHGNAGHMGHRLETIRHWHQLDYNIIIFDYAGYGNSTGDTNEENSYKGVEACLKWLDQHKFSRKELIVHGRSLGGAVATYIATKEHLPKLILESTFTSIPDMAAYRFPFLPTRLLATTHFPTLERLSTFKGEALILHSRDDEIIPFYMGQRLAHEVNTELIELSGGHNDSQTSRPVYETAIKRFIK